MSLTPTHGVLGEGDDIRNVSTIEIRVELLA